MTWLDQLQRASFRGVPFQVDTIDHSAGDNVVMREYPFQDLPTVFRMGEAAEEIKLSAYVIGDRVFHQKFGYGEVMAIEGDKLDIEFDHAGSKKIVARWVIPAHQVDDVPF